MDVTGHGSLMLVELNLDYELSCQGEVSRKPVPLQNCQTMQNLSAIVR
jgi:hypothetical protein